MISDMVSYVFAFCGAQVTSNMTWGQDGLFKLTCKFMFSKYKLYIKWTKVELFRLLHHRTRKVPQILLPNPNVHSEQRADGSPSGQAWGHVLCRLSTCLSPLVVPSPARGRTLSHKSPHVTMSFPCDTGLKGKCLALIHSVRVWWDVCLYFWKKAGRIFCWQQVWLRDCRWHIYKCELGVSWLHPAVYE